MRLSVIMPARKELFMQKTIDAFLGSSELGYGVEILAVLDGPWMDEPTGDRRVKVIRLPEPLGMRGAINAGLAEASGDFVMKLDAHCAFDRGFDRKMVEVCAENWLVIPRRFSLDDISWTMSKRKPARDYHYLAFPMEKYGYSMTPQVWPKKFGPEIDDTMSFQGSCWLANREYFMSHVGLLDDRKKTYGSFAAEQLEVGLKYWLGGGEVKVNKRTWYAHLWKMPRHYATGEFAKKSNFHRNWRWAARHWMKNGEPNMIHPFSWLVEKFSPVPTWPEDREQWKPF
jgi:glycosyltransferase involved in cell wall biosynthesis